MCIVALALTAAGAWTWDWRAEWVNAANIDLVNVNSAVHLNNNDATLSNTHNSVDRGFNTSWTQSYELKVTADAVKAGPGGYKFYCEEYAGHSMVDRKLRVIIADADVGDYTVTIEEERTNFEWGWTVAVGGADPPGDDANFGHVHCRSEMGLFGSTDKYETPTSWGAFDDALTSGSGIVKVSGSSVPASHYATGEGYFQAEKTVKPSQSGMDLSWEWKDEIDSYLFSYAGFESVANAQNSASGWLNVTHYLREDGVMGEISSIYVTGP